MNKNIKKKLIRFAIVFVIDVLITLFIASTKDIFKTTNVHTIYHILVDSFFVSGTLTFCYGMMILIADEGGFDIFVYGTRKFIDLFRKSYNKKVNETYYDYVESKGRRATPFWHIVIVGSIFIAVSLILLIFYYKTI